MKHFFTCYRLQMDHLKKKPEALIALYVVNMVTLIPMVINVNLHMYLVIHVIQMHQKKMMMNYHQNNKKMNQLVQQIIHQYDQDQHNQIIQEQQHQKHQQHYFKMNIHQFKMMMQVKN